MLRCIPLAAAATVALPAVQAQAQPPPITNGTDAPDDASVVGLVYDGVLHCTGTLISSYLVLTAGHCVHTETPSGVTFALDPTLAAVELAVAAAVEHPAFDAGDLANDIAGVVLAAAAPVAAAPRELHRSGPLEEGTELRLVGYGRTSALAEDEGVRRQGTAVIDSVDALEFRYLPSPSQACLGDSGGPAFASMDGAELVVGVTSHGDSLCASHGVDARVDAQVAGFIEPLLAAVAERGIAPGGRCFHGDSCAGGTCVAPLGDGHRYCSVSCARDEDCPPATGACVSGACRPAVEPGGFGAACREALDCASGLCRAAPGGGSACTRRCDPAAPACPDDTVCEPDDLAPQLALCSLEPAPGCSSAGGRGDVALPWLLSLFFFYKKRTRRAARPRTRRPWQVASAT